jgi:hypothetical protein
MYPYLVTKRDYMNSKIYIFTVNSEKNPLKNYIVKIEYGKYIKASCSCKGFAIRGKCKHINICMRKIIYNKNLQ